MHRKPTIEILERYLNGQATEEERRLVDEWYEAADAYGITEEAVPPHIREELYQKIVRAVPGSSPRVLSFPGWRMVAAAAVILLTVLTGVWWMQKDGRPAPSLSRQAAPPAPPGDVLPGGDKARLILADGSVIELDSAGNGSLTRQGNVQVIKLDDGRLKYDAGTGDAGQENLLYNTIATPKGGQYRLTLPDGSTVWLNAASSLRFPVAFERRERVVEITGEAFFDITRDEHRPFTVRTDKGMEVRVLGTSFNVNVYGDEPSQTVTVVSGKVSVQQGAASGMVRLSPGQQAFSGSGGLERREAVNVEQITAWKSGLFHFQSEDIASIMRQVSRWYDVEVVFPQGVPQGSITGKVRRDMNLSQVLKVFELSGIKCHLDENRLTVLP